MKNQSGRSRKQWLLPLFQPIASILASQIRNQNMQLSHIFIKDITQQLHKNLAM